MQPIASSSIAPITVVNTRVIFCQAENFSEPDFNFRANSSSIYPASRGKSLILFTYYSPAHKYWNPCDNEPDLRV